MGELLAFPFGESYRKIIIPFIAIEVIMSKFAFQVNGIKVTVSLINNS